MLYLIEPFGVTINLFNSLIVWDNPFGVDVPLTGKPGGWFVQAEAENVPEGNFE